MNSVIHINDFKLSNGQVMPTATVAYKTMGQLSADGRNAVLITHGYTSGPNMVEADSNAVEGSWSELVGPGKPIDTDKLFIVCPNMLGSSYGSSNGSSINPTTLEPYGLEFPNINLLDIVESQKKLLDSLGVKHLVAVAGPSFGGFQAFQWAVSYPDFVDGIVAATCAPFAPQIDVEGIEAMLAVDPNWNNGNYYDTDGVIPTMVRMRNETLRAFGIEAVLAPRFPGQYSRDAEIQRIAEQWAKHFDANSLVILMRAAKGFDLRPQLHRVKARIMFLLSNTDRIFPSSLSQTVMADLRDAGIRAEYHELETPNGHFASGLDHRLWSAELRRFIEDLATLV
jgi:homoserine O-acetyltransferase